MSGPSRPCLYLLRHAHSSWALPGQRDHQRPLDERGRTDAPKIGAEIARADYRFDTVVCSTAVRAVETLAFVRPHLSQDTAEIESDDLYALGVEAYFAAARTGRSGSLMLVGHNPMIEEFAASLAGKGEAEALDGLKQGFPTAGLAVIEFEAPLSQIEPGTGFLRRLVHPKTL